MSPRQKNHKLKVKDLRRLELNSPSECTTPKYPGTRNHSPRYPYSPSSMMGIKKHETAKLVPQRSTVVKKQRPRPFSGKVSHTNRLQVNTSANRQ